MSGCAVAVPARVMLGRGMTAEVSGSVAVICSAGDRVAVRVSRIVPESAPSLHLLARAGDARAIVLNRTSASGALVVTVLL
jgi:hypothetical protein